MKCILVAEEILNCWIRNEEYKNGNFILNPPWGRFKVNDVFFPQGQDKWSLLFCLFVWFWFWGFSGTGS